LITPTTWTIGGRRNEATRHVRFARPFLAALARVSQDATGHCAALVFQRPPRFARTRGEQRALAGGAPVRVSGRRGDVAIWQWGTGPRVLLVHGWGGNAARLRHFVTPLLEAGFGVALIGHSMGGSACALALKTGLAADAAVLLSPPADPLRYALRFARYLRLQNAAVTAMRRRLEAGYGAPLADLCVTTGGGPSVPMLVIHDEGDARVPIRDGRAIAASWPMARLVATRGLGHHRILRDPRVVAAGVAFVGDAVGARVRVAAAGGQGNRGHAS
jgi:pimeloyl-ACP methyl ester carboxylesterase